MDLSFKLKIKILAKFGLERQLDNWWLLQKPVNGTAKF